MSETASVNRGWVAAGAMAMSLGLALVGGLGWSLAPEVESTADPGCVRNLGLPQQERAVRVHATAAGERTFVLGLDRSPSNAGVARSQLAEALTFARDLPVEDGLGILFVSDRSDRSTTPDLPWEPSSAHEHAVIDPSPCGDRCAPASLFESSCLVQWEAALADRRDALAGEIAARREASRVARNARLDAWASSVADYWPRSGTSLRRFWNKVADLPSVRENPESVTVVLWSDLEEIMTDDRREIERWARTATPEVCPASPLLPAGLAGVRVILLQTVGERRRSEVWGERWETALRCAGASVTRFRYSASVRVADTLRASAKAP